MPAKRAKATRQLNPSRVGDARPRMRRQVARGLPVHGRRCASGRAARRAQRVAAAQRRRSKSSERHLATLAIAAVVRRVEGGEGGSCRVDEADYVDHLCLQYASVVRLHPAKGLRGGVKLANFAPRSSESARAQSSPVVATSQIFDNPVARSMSLRTSYCSSSVCNCLSFAAHLLLISA